MTQENVKTELNIKQKLEAFEATYQNVKESYSGPEAAYSTQTEELYRTLNSVAPGNSTELFKYPSPLHDYNSFTTLPGYIKSSIGVTERAHMQMWIGADDLKKVISEFPNLNTATELESKAEDRVASFVQFIEYFGDYYISSIFVTNSHPRGRSYRCRDKDEFALKAKEYLKSSTKDGRNVLTLKDVCGDNIEYGKLYGKIPPYFTQQFYFDDLIYCDNPRGDLSTITPEEVEYLTNVRDLDQFVTWVINGAPSNTKDKLKSFFD